MRDPPHQQWHAALAAAVAALGGGDFFATLLAWLTQLAPCGQPLVLLFRPGALPRVLFERMSAQEHQRHVQWYLHNGAWLLDPFYHLSQARNPCGVFLLSRIAPDRFRSTEFYRSYYRQTGIHHEASLLLPLDDQSSVHVSLSRGAGEQRFSAQELALLESAVPLAHALVQRHVGAVGALAGGGSEMHRQLQHVLEHFGSSLLTRREREVLALVLHGHSNRAVAARLGISEATAKLHRKNTYHKLDIGSHAELFHLFLDSLASYDPTRECDPLAQYFGRASA